MGVAADSAAAAQERFMRAALEMAHRGMAAGGPPVGACLVSADRIIAKSHNSVVGELDVTAHAEIVVIREACRALRQLSLEGCVLYVTVEPCPMCLTACHYAGVRQIFYGASIAAMDAITGHELCVAPLTLFGGRADQPLLEGGLLAADCQALLDTWGAAAGGTR
jgi:tRNA(Arg) A34 adenosine deaminase TadA